MGVATAAAGVALGLAERKYARIGGGASAQLLEGGDLLSNEAVASEIYQGMCNGTLNGTKMSDIYAVYNVALHNATLACRELEQIWLEYNSAFWRMTSPMIWSALFYVGLLLLTLALRDIKDRLPPSSTWRALIAGYIEKPPPAEEDAGGGGAAAGKVALLGAPSADSGAAQGPLVRAANRKHQLLLDVRDFVLCATFVISTLILYGIYQERVMTKRSNAPNTYGEKFSYVSFLTCCNRFAPMPPPPSPTATALCRALSRSESHLASPRHV